MLRMFQTNQNNSSFTTLAALTFLAGAKHTAAECMDGCGTIFIPFQIPLPVILVPVGIVGSICVLGGAITLLALHCQGKLCKKTNTDSEELKLLSPPQP